VNLYLNAIEAMGRDGRLRVIAHTTESRPGFVQIDVSDTGRGIAQDALPYVFDPFFTTKGAKGTGLGLSVSYGIVAKHAGSIQVQSRPAEGTTFSVFLPIAGDRAAEASASKGNPSEGANTHGTASYPKRQ